MKKKILSNLIRENFPFSSLQWSQTFFRDKAFLRRSDKLQIFKLWRPNFHPIWLRGLAAKSPRALTRPWSGEVSFLFPIVNFKLWKVTLSCLSTFYLPRLHVWVSPNFEIATFPVVCAKSEALNPRNDKGEIIWWTHSIQKEFEFPIVSKTTGTGSQMRSGDQISTG